MRRRTPDLRAAPFDSCVASPDTARVFRQLFSDRLTRDPLQTAFGALEREVMAILWADGNLAVRDVQARLRRPAAYTTVMTTLDRLFKKGVLSREQSGRAFVYSAAVSHEELKASIASRVISGLLQGRGTAVPLLSNLVDTVGAQDGGADLLRALEEMVREKRRRLGRRTDR